VNQKEKAICMNTPYISVLKVLEIVNKTVVEYDEMSRNGKNNHEKKVGHYGRSAAIKIKNNIIKDIKGREGILD
jgi:hypothetical protein